MGINWGGDYPYGYLDDEPVSPKVKPQPEPDWRAMYVWERDGAATLRGTIKRLEEDLAKEKKLKDTFFTRYQELKERLIEARWVLRGKRD